MVKNIIISCKHNEGIDLLANMADVLHNAMTVTVSPANQLSSTGLHYPSFRMMDFSSLSSYISESIDRTGATILPKRFEFLCRP